VLFVPAHVLPLWSPRRAVVTIHDLGYLYYPEAHPGARRLYLRLSTLWNARRATRIIAISESTKRDIVQHCRLPASKIEVVPHGVDARFRPVSDAEQLGRVRERYGTGPSYVLCVGTVQPRKNLLRLIEAWAEYVKHARAPAPTLVLAGKQGWLAEAIYRRPQELGIADRVRFTGYVAGDDLPALIGGALAYVMPSLYEGFGMPILEAQACGMPVLASPISSLAEAAGDAALFVDPLDVRSIAEGIARIVEDAELRARLRERGLRRVTTWTWERTARETLRVLEGVEQQA
jgi:glycosyltransferase involved in cell wall biosynthesis